jgi:hypothetical protein
MFIMISRVRHILKQWTVLQAFTAKSELFCKYHQGHREATEYPEPGFNFIGLGLAWGSGLVQASNFPGAGCINHFFNHYFVVK